MLKTNNATYNTETECDAIDTHTVKQKSIFVETIPNMISRLTRTSALTLCSLCALHATGALAMDDYTTPTGENVVGGSATFERPSAGQLNVTQGTDRLVVDWDNFNIGAKAKTEFFQPNANSLAVNRVTSVGTDPTKILGTLSGNGQIMVLDRNGVFVGKDAIVNASAVTFATGDVDLNAVMRGDTVLDMNNFGDGSIINEGAISVVNAGLVAFVGKYVSNQGTITARMGRVALAATGERVTLDLYGDGLVEIALDEAKGAALAENLGTINAEGGIVHMSARAAKGVVDDVINMDGVIQATSFTQKGGKIILNGGDSGRVTVSGEADVSGALGGGDILVEGADVDVTQTAELRANSTNNGNGGSIILRGQNLAILNGSTQARGGNNSGNGGFIELSSDDAFLINGTVDTSAANGETGTFLIDPRDIDLRLGTRTSIFDFNLYESDIEGLSAFTNIILEARRNFSINSAIFGLGSDGVVTLATDRDLTIQTTNTPFSSLWINELDNSGTIDLTGNATYGSDLEFKTSGTGSISVLGGTANDEISDIILSRLTTDGGDINVSTLTGDINWMNTVQSNGGTITGYSHENQSIVDALQSNGGDIHISNNADTLDDIIQIETTGSVMSGGGNITFDTNIVNGGWTVSHGLIDAGNGDVSFSNRQTQLHDSTLYANKVSFAGNRVTQKAAGVIEAAIIEGQIAENAQFLGQNDIDTVSHFITGTGGWNTGEFTLNDIDGFNVDGVVSTTGGDITLSTQSTQWDQSIIIDTNGELTSNGGDINIDTNGSSGGSTRSTGLIDAGSGDVSINSRQTQLQNSALYANKASFTGSSVTQDALGVIAAARIEGTLAASAQFLGQNDIDTVGDFATGEGNWSVGLFTLNNFSNLNIDGAISTTGGDITIMNDGNVALNTGATINANSGDILINQTGTFASVDADTVKTSGTGTIMLNQNDGGSLNDVFQSLDNTGTGLNTVTVAAGTYLGEATINDDNVLAIGANAGLSSEDAARTAESVVTAAGGTALNIVDATNVVIDSFTFDGSANGVVIDGSDEVSVMNSIFSNNTVGYMSRGEDNVSLALNDTRFEDNTTGAFFESGSLDLTAANLRFIGGQDAMRFAPANNTPNLELIDNTLGNTYFSGQSRYFVVLDNGAFFAPGGPTVMNGIDATYETSAGTIQPRAILDLDETLSAEALNFLENRFYHNIDDATLGLFYYGQPGFDEEDLTKTFSSFTATPGALNLTVTGLPNVTAQRIATPTASSLANIAPAAGEEAITPESLANITPAAGGKNVSCWGDALSDAGANTTVTFNFGTGSAQLLNDAAACSSTDI